MNGSERAVQILQRDRDRLRSHLEDIRDMPNRVPGGADLHVCLMQNRARAALLPHPQVIRGKRRWFWIALGLVALSLLILALVGR